MFDFIRIQYELGNLTKERLQTYAPRWITADQVNQILQSATNQT